MLNSWAPLGPETAVVDAAVHTAILTTAHVSKSSLVYFQISLSSTSSYLWKMPLSVLCALPADALSISLIRYAAFGSSHPIYMLAYRHVPPSALLAAELEASEQDLTSSRTVPVQTLKVVDTQTGEIVSTGKWHLPYDIPSSNGAAEHEGADGVRELAYPEGTNKAVLLEYEKVAGEMNGQMWKGKRCYSNFLLSPFF